MRRMQEMDNKVAENSASSEKTAGEGRIYEVGYLLVPNIPEENISVNYGNLRDFIVSLGGELISDEMPKMTQLAYTMDKVIQNKHHRFDVAYFGWIKFEIDPSKVSDIKKKLDMDTEIIRFLILKTIRENTVVGKRFMQAGYKRKSFSAKKEGEESSVDASLPINKEEIDKEIDAMVSA